MFAYGQVRSHLNLNIHLHRASTYQKALPSLGTFVGNDLPIITYSGNNALEVNPD